MGLYCFDYGHGGKDPGAMFNGRKESDDVLLVGMKTAGIMRANGHTVDETRTTDTTLSLNQRSNFANRKKYDAVVSFHRNAFNREAKGVEVFSYPGSVKGRELAIRMQNELVKFGFVNRGAKTQNLHMLREPKAVAVLPEIGFIDSVEDNKIFDANIDAIAVAIAKSLIGNINNNVKVPKPAPSKPKAPVSKASNNNVTVDGIWGKEVNIALQKSLGTYVDGIMSGQYSTETTKSIYAVTYNHRRGSTMVRALQRKLGVNADGLFGPATVRALQIYLKTPVDGIISRPSTMVRELQRRLNNNTF